VGDGGLWYGSLLGPRSAVPGASGEADHPRYVRPYRRRNKTDRNDCDAMLEAARCQDIHPVPVKSHEQQQVQQLHGLRETWKKSRTQRINLLRGILREAGIEAPAATAAFLRVAHQLVDRAELEPLRHQLHIVLAEINLHEQCMVECDQQLKRWHAEDEVVHKLDEVSGIGLLTASALKAAVGKPERFASGRQLSAWLGLTPNEYSSGERRRLGRISCKGNIYVRTLFIHGSRAALLAAQSNWLRRSGCVTIGTVHGTKSGHKAYASLDAVIAVSAGIAAQLQHPSVHVIANGVAPRVPDPHIVADCRQQRAAWSGALVLAIGRLAPVKGFDLLLQAWPSDADAHLLILGDGPEHGALQQQIAQLGLSDRVTLGGHSSAVTEWLHVADAMVISSHREGFPYVLVEALQAGCPVLSTQVSGVNEIVPPAYLVVPGEHALLNDLLQRFIPQLGLLRQEQGPLFARALDELTLVAMAGKTLNLYLALRGHTHE